MVLSRPKPEGRDELSFDSVAILSHLCTLDRFVPAVPHAAQGSICARSASNQPFRACSADTERGVSEPDKASEAEGPAR
jgi:hypothetical protein